MNKENGLARGGEKMNSIQTNHLALSDIEPDEKCTTIHQQLASFTLDNITAIEQIVGTFNEAITTVASCWLLVALSAKSSAHIQGGGPCVVSHLVDVVPI